MCMAKKNKGEGKPLPQSPAARKQTQRRLNREHLQANDWQSDAEAFITAWRRGEIKVTFEYTDKADHPGVDELSSERKVSNEI